MGNLQNIGELLKTSSTGFYTVNDGLYPSSSPQLKNTTQYYLVILDWNSQLVLQWKAREPSDSCMHVKGENVCKNLTGQNYLDSIPNYAEMRHDSSSFYRKDKEILLRICYKAAPSPVKYYCANKECAVSNWATFKKHNLSSRCCYHHLCFLKRLFALSLLSVTCHLNSVLCRTVSVVSPLQVKLHRLYLTVHTIFSTWHFKSKTGFSLSHFIINQELVWFLSFWGGTKDAKSLKYQYYFEDRAH